MAAYLNFEDLTPEEQDSARRKIVYAEDSTYRLGDVDLYDEDKNCEHLTTSNFYGGGGIKCIRCPGWFCF